MKATGRLNAELRPAAARIVFSLGDGGDGAKARLDRATRVDEAHLVMLSEAELVDWADAATLLTAIARARETGYREVLAKPTPRGWYTAWEDHLIDAVGRKAGILQTGRSRNDLNATVALLSLRSTWRSGGDRLAGTAQALATAAGRWRSTPIPMYTNGQPAAPVVFGHWLAACGISVTRDLLTWGPYGSGPLAECPLGAAATAGTSLPIDPERTARLLGFRRPFTNSIEAVASRDAHFGLASAAVEVTRKTSRMARSLMQWCRPGGCVSLPDDLCGASSSLPQKRNPFLLDHIVAAHARVLGAYVTASTAAAGAPFENSISVGTEAVGALEGGFDAFGQALTLSTEVVSALTVDARRADDELRASFATALALAEKLVISTDATFREAHQLVGRLIGRSETEGRPLVEVAADEGLAGTLYADADLEPATVAMTVRSPGGAGPQTVDACVRWIEAKLDAWRAAAEAADLEWSDADAALDAAVNSVREQSTVAATG